MLLPPMHIRLTTLERKIKAFERQIAAFDRQITDYQRQLDEQRQHQEDLAHAAANAGIHTRPHKPNDP
jgi:uncharacterized coiled-coil protein SlyX